LKPQPPQHQQQQLVIIRITRSGRAGGSVVAGGQAVLVKATCRALLPAAASANHLTYTGHDTGHLPLMRTYAILLTFYPAFLR